MGNDVWSSHILEASKPELRLLVIEKVGDNLAQWEGAGHDRTG